jgi:hypothetical protein
MLPPMKTRALVATMAVAALTLAACGGDDSSNDKSSGSTSGNGHTLPTTGNSTYDQLLKKAESSRYRVTYTSSDDDKTFTVSHDPPKSAFITSDSMYIQTGDGTVTCENVGSADASCTQLSTGGMSADTITQGFFGVYAALLAAGKSGIAGGLLDVKKTSDETIAGRDASCAQIDGSRLGKSGDTLKACVDKDTGVLLLGETTGSDANKIEATEFGDPKDSDFQPPVTPSTTPSFTTPST